MYKRIFLFLSLIAFTSSLFQIFKYWDYQQILPNLDMQIQLHVSKQNLIREIEQSIDNGEFDDARMYLEISKNHHFDIDHLAYQQKIDTQDTRFNNIQKNLAEFATGFMKGKSSNAAGIAGAVSADFTVIGDVRDLHSEYQHYQQGEEVNELIVALSGAGIGLTAITVGSLGSAAPAKSGVSLIKLASKTRRLTSRFQKQILRLAQNVFDWKTFTRLIKESNSIKQSVSQIPRAAKLSYHPKAIEPLSDVAKQVNHVRQTTSISDTLNLLKYVETTDDLRHLEKVSLKYGTQTKGIMKLLGKGAIRTVKVLRKTAELFLSLVSAVFSAMLSLYFLFAGKKPG